MGYVKDVEGSERLELAHKSEDAVVLASGTRSNESIVHFCKENILPIFGRLTNTTYEWYLEAASDLERGMIWTLFPQMEQDETRMDSWLRPIMLEVAKEFKSSYFV